MRVDSALLHGINVVLAARVALALGLSAPLAWSAALLWGLHPMCVASVCWITERKNVLYVCFFLTTLLLYRRATDDPESTDLRWYALSLVTFVLALLSKGAAMTLFPVLLLFEWARGRALTSRLGLIAPYAVLGLVAATSLVAATPEERHVDALAVRLPLAARALWFYVGTFFWPALVPLYPKWIEEVGTTEVVALAAAVGTAVALALAWRRLPRTVLFGVGFYVLNALPVIGIVWFTFFRLSLVSDHLAYLPILGLALAVVAGAAEAARRAAIPERTLVVGLGLWIVVLGAMTNRYAVVWSDGPTLWRAALAADPSSFHAHTGLGDELGPRDEAGAIAEYEAALRIRPHAGTQLALAQLYLKANRNDEAMDGFRRAIELGSGDWRAPYALGTALLQAGRAAEAVPVLEKARAMQGHGASVENNLAVAYLQTGDVAAARQALDTALRMDPGDANTAVTLGAIIERQDGADAARAFYQRAVQNVQPGPGRAQLEARMKALGEAAH
jgi:tetratricopeptide (TPR) repeat protein